MKNRITQVETQAASADRETARAQSEEQQSLSDRGRIERIKAEISSRLQSRQTELLSITDQRKDVESELQTTRGALGETRQTLDRARNEHSRLKARKESLEDIIQHRSYTPKRSSAYSPQSKRTKLVSSGLSVYWRTSWK